MGKLRALWLRVYGLFHKPADADAELASHLDLHIEENVRAGMRGEEARRAALIKLGGLEQTRQAYREQASVPVMENLLRDLYQALRRLVKAPVFTVTVVVTLALGIGANTAIYSVMEGVLEHPAGIDHPERVLVLKTKYKKYNLNVPDVSVPVYATAAAMPEVEAGAVESTASFNLLENGRIQHVAAALVSAKWFQVFGAQPILGRTFAPEEDQPGAGAVTVLSYGMWQSAFGGSQDVVGRNLMLDGKAYRVIGVMRSDFAWPRGSQIWIPIALAPAAFAPDQGFNENYEAVVRLRNDISVEQFNARFSTKMWSEVRRLGGAPYAIKSGWSVYAVLVADFAAGSLKKPLYVLIGVVLLVLLIASANVAGLQLARASGRTKEFAVRAALGASSGRIMQQLLVEALLLSSVAAVVGMAAGPVLGRLLLLMAPESLAKGFITRTDLRVLAFTAAVALLSSLISGLGPALRVIRQQRRLQLQEGSRSTTASVERQRLRSGLVILEVALAFLLLAGTGLFLTGVAKLETVNPGFNPAGVLSARVDYAGEDFKKNQARQAAFVRTTIDELGRQPGVTAAAAVDTLPFDPNDTGSASFDIEGHVADPNQPGPHSMLNYATPGYLKVMQIPLLRGRWFNEDDRKGTQRVAVIDERLARLYWPGKDPLGQHIDSQPDHSWVTVVGVVGNIRTHSLEEDTSDGMRYYAYAQMDDAVANFLVRIDGDPTRVADAMKRAVYAADATQAVTTVIPIETLVSDSLAGQRLVVWMLSAFAGLALLLSVIGIYALISYVTAQRSSEIGMRMALGAQRRGILQLVMQKALAWVGAGLILGAGLSVLMTTVLNHYFAEFGGGLVRSLLGTAAVLIFAGGMAALMPAVRAASIEPTKALRAE